MSTMDFSLTRTALWDEQERGVPHDAPLLLPRPNALEMSLATRLRMPFACRRSNRTSAWDLAMGNYSLRVG